MAAQTFSNHQVYLQHGGVVFGGRYLDACNGDVRLFAVLYNLLFHVIHQYLTELGSIDCSTTTAYFVVSVASSNAEANSA